MAYLARNAGVQPSEYEAMTVADSVRLAIEVQKLKQADERAADLLASEGTQMTMRAIAGLVR